MWKQKWKLSLFMRKILTPGVAYCIALCHQEQATLVAGKLSQKTCEDSEKHEHTQSKPTAKKTKQSSISRFFQVETILEMGLQKGCEQVCV